MNLEALGIEGAWLLKSQVHSDNRGSFLEWFKTEEILISSNIKFEVKQINISQSKLGVIRGIHYSLTKIGQVKIITCLEGSILDVIVDLRKNSPTFKKWISLELNAISGQSILISSGLGHGFMALKDLTVVSYALSSEYSPSEEFEINAFDPSLKINWQPNLTQNITPIISQKDSNAPSLDQRNSDRQLP